MPEVPQLDKPKVWVVDELIVGHAQPVCRGCGCHSLVETIRSDDSVQQRCECCGQPASWETRPQWERPVPRSMTVPVPEDARVPPGIHQSDEGE